MRRRLTVSAPGRVGVAGNPSDMYGGSVVSCSTLERAQVIMEESDALRISCEELSEVVEDDAALDLRGDFLEIIRAALCEYGLGPKSLEASIHISSNVPRRSGLAGSTAVAVSLTAALHRWLGRTEELHLLAECARRIEAGRMDIVCGFQDQYMAAYGGVCYLDFRGKEKLTQEDGEPYATVESLEGVELPLVAGHTGISRDSDSVHRSPRERWEQGDPVYVRAFAEIGAIGRMAKKAVLQSDWPELGRLMCRNHAIVRDLGMSNKVNESLIEAAMDSGAWGAKLAGAGKGGTIVALTPDMGKTEQALRAAGAHEVYHPKPSPGVVIHDE